MMIYIIIIFHNQLDNIYPILKKMEKQSISPDKIIISCDIAHKKIIKEYNFNLNIIFSEHQKTQHFSAGLNRDLAINEIKTLNDDDILIFLDGDCIPKKNVIEEHIVSNKIFNNYYISCGLRHKIEPEGIIHDRRMKYSGNNHRLLFTSFDSTINTITWTCNLSTNGYTVKKIKKINNILNGDHRLFNSIFDRHWGLEDNFIGICAYLTGADIVMCPRMSYVKHIHHETSMKNKLSIQKKNLMKMIKRLNNKIQNKQINLDDSNEYEIYKLYLTILEKKIIKDDNLIKMLLNRTTELYDHVHANTSMDNKQITTINNLIHKNLTVTRENGKIVIK